MPTMPTGLEPVIQGYAHRGPGGVVRTEIAGGANRYALDWDRGVQQFSVTMVLSAVAFQVWNHFFHNTIKKGALSFTMKLDSGWGANDHTANLIPGSYNVTWSSSEVRVVTFEVEAESQAYTYDDEGDALVAAWEALGNQTDEVLAALEQFATVDSLVLDF